jgi:hypothetical protein
MTSISAETSTRLTFFTQKGAAIEASLTSKEETNAYGTLLKVFEIHEIATKKLLGEMNAKVNWLVHSSTADQKIGKENGWLEINRIDNYTYDQENKVKGIGTYLIGCAIEESRRHGLKGRLRLIACDNAAYFFWSCGFRPVNEKLIAEMRQNYEKARAEGKHAEYRGGLYMKLSEVKT